MERTQLVGSQVHFTENTLEITERLALVDRAEAIEGIQRGLASMKRGQGRPAAEVFAEIRLKNSIPREG